MDRPAAWDVVIIGAGMGGLATAIWARRLGLTTLVLEQQRQAGGQLTAIAGRIVDYPGLDLPEGGALAKRLVQQAAQAGAELRLEDPALAVEASTLTVRSARGQVRAGAVVLATGITARRLEVAGEEELYRHRLVRRPSHDLDWFRGKRVAVIGGGDRAAENALLLAGVAAQVHLLHRGAQLRARPALAGPLAAAPRVAVHLQTRVTGFTVRGGQVEVAAEQAGAPVALPVEAVCIYIGNRPNSQLVAGQVELDAEGYIVTDRHGQSSQPGLYAVGDVCTQPAFQSLATASGQAMVVAKAIALRNGG
ncbi:MAG: NAD(P)/FAD-dependent oxidoreductase [Bacillota bacterium]